MKFNVSRFLAHSFVFLILGFDLVQWCLFYNLFYKPLLSLTLQRRTEVYQVGYPSLLSDNINL